MGPCVDHTEAVRIFREVNPAGKGGTIVQVSSIGGYLTFPGSAFYHASKFTLGRFTQSFAREMDPSWGIKFMMAVPGGIKSNFHTAAQIGPRHPVYDTPTGPLNQLIQYTRNPAIQDVFSDPDQIAKVLFDAVVGQDERPQPTRLLMGGELIPFLEAEQKRVADEAEAWKEETLSCSLNGETTEVPIFWLRRLSE